MGVLQIHFPTGFAKDPKVWLDGARPPPKGIGITFYVKL